MDGQKSLDELLPEITAIAQVDRDTAAEFIEGFYSENFIDMFPVPYSTLDESYGYFKSAITSYASSGMGGYKLFERLQKTKVAILGCGSGGSHIAFFLAQLGVGNIHVVDPDKLTVKNVNHQALFEIGHVGKFKVDAFKDALSAKNPFVNLSISHKRIDSKNDVIREISGCDWVFCCMDEPPYIAQRLVNSGAMQLGIPSMYCFSQKDAGKCFMVLPGESGCVDCLLAKYDSADFRELTKVFLDGSDGLFTATTAVNIGLLTSWIVNKWLMEFTCLDRSVFGKLFRFDFRRFEEEVFDDWQKVEICPSCGTDKGNSELWTILKFN